MADASSEEKRKNSSPFSAVDRKELSLILRLWPYLRPDSWLLIAAALLTPFIAGLQLLQPYLIKVAVDEHILNKQLEGLSDIAFIYLFTAFASYLLSVCYTVSISYAGQKMLLRLRKSLYDRVLSLPLSYFDHQPAGVLLTRLTNDVAAIGESIGAGVINIFLDILMVVGCLSLMFYLDVELSLMLLFCSPFLLFLINWMRLQLRRLYLEIREAIASVNAHLSEQIDGVEILQIFSAEERSKNIFAEHNNHFRHAQKISNIYDALLFAFVDGMGSVLIGLILWYGSGLLGADIVGGTGALRTAGVMIAYIDYLNRLLGPVRDLSSKVAIIQRSLAALVKIFGLVDSCEPQDRTGQHVEGLNGALQIRELRFSYSSDGPEILKGINLDVQAGEVVAIVGSSGSGKTTLTRILDRSYTGYEGSISVDGVELKEISIDSLRRLMSAVRQDIQIFSDTVRFNIDLNNPTISDKERDLALELTHAQSFVEQLGLMHQLKERGRDLSIGQGQLITFARAMAHNPQVVILDEATASVDSITESYIQQAIEQILKNKTVIVIAHRLSTIQQADRIAVMEQGEVVEQGTHQELLSLQGRYAELVAAAEEAVH